MGSGVQAGLGIGQDREAESSGGPSDRVGGTRVVLRADHHHPSLPGERSGERPDGFFVRGGDTEIDPRHRTHRRRDAIDGDQRFPETQIEVNRPDASDGLGHQPGGEGGREAGCRFAGGGDVEIVAPDWSAAVDAALVDRLWRSGLPEVGGPVGRDDYQRDSPVAGLDDRRVDLGGGRSGRAGDQCGYPGRLPDPEGEEGCGAFVVVGPVMDAVFGGQSHGHGGVPRPGGHGCMRDAEFCECRYER